MRGGRETVPGKWKGWREMKVEEACRINGYWGEQSLKRQSQNSLKSLKLGNRSISEGKWAVKSMFSQWENMYSILNFLGSEWLQDIDTKMLGHGAATRLGLEAPSNIFITQPCQPPVFPLFIIYLFLNYVEYTTTHNRYFTNHR